MFTIISMFENLIKVEVGIKVRELKIGKKSTNSGRAIIRYLRARNGTDLQDFGIQLKVGHAPLKKNF